MNTDLTIPVTLNTMILNEPDQPPADPSWGWHLVLNLYQCDPDLIKSYQVIEKFVIDLCDIIEMRRFGDPTIVNFGDNPDVTGYSLVQLIETSNICGHFANKWRSVYLDIFSCKKFNPQVAANFCVETFKAKKAAGTFIYRD